MDLEQIKLYLNVDYDDNDELITELIDVAQIYIDKCAGEAYKIDTKLLTLSQLLLKKFIKDLYEKRSASEEHIKIDRVAQTILIALSNAGENI